MDEEYQHILKHLSKRRHNSDYIQNYKYDAPYISDYDFDELKQLKNIIEQQKASSRVATTVAEPKTRQKISAASNVGSNLAQALNAL